jgi:hypothetical protein
MTQVHVRPGRTDDAGGFRALDDRDENVAGRR